jgi:hypothetical protein
MNNSFQTQQCDLPQRILPRRAQSSPTLPQHGGCFSLSPQQLIASIKLTLRPENYGKHPLMEWGQFLNIPPCSFPDRAMFVEISPGLSLGGLAPPVSVLGLAIAKYLLFFPKMLTFDAVPRRSGEQICLGNERPGYISTRPRAFKNRSRITNLEINAQIRDAFFGPTASNSDDSILSESRRTTSTPIVSENGRTSSKPFPSLY